MTGRLDRARWVAFGGVVGLSLLLFWSVFIYTAWMFNDPLEDLTHGWVVPFVSAFLVWRQRGALREAAGRPSGRGLAWLCLFLVLGWFGGRGQQPRLEQLALIGLVWSVPYALWGHRVGSLLRLPVAYLLFIIPVASYLDFFTIHLRILASSISVVLLNGFGLPVEQSGTALISRAAGGGFNVDVAEPCSGIRSLFAMMALTAAYACLLPRSAFFKWALFACSIPIALVGNIVRILSICLVAWGFGQEVATGYYHDYSGYVVFLAGIGLMIGSGNLLARVGARVPDSLRPSGWRRRGCGAETERRPERPVAALGAYGVVALVAVLPGVLLALKRNMPEPTFDTVEFVAQELPERIEGFVSERPWFCHNEQCLVTEEESVLRLRGAGREGGGYGCPACGGAMHEASLGEVSLLPRDTAVSKRNYRAGDGLKYSVSLVVAGRRRGSIHRPELCLPAQGFVMMGARQKEVRVAGGSPRRVRVLTVERPDGARFSLAYWFFCRDRESCSHTDRIVSDVWDRTVHNRINRWVMVAVAVPSDLAVPESMERFEAFLSGLSVKLRP